MSKFITLTNGGKAIIDDEDFERVSKFSWECHKPRNTSYARFRFRSEGKQKCVYLHRFIAGVKVGIQIDHINHDGLNCQKSNLRIATCSENLQNARKRKTLTSSKFKGVSWHKQRSKWRVTIGHKHIGVFLKEMDAAKAYDAAAKSAFGQFACTNF
jgi:hypothetical protein